MFKRVRREWYRTLNFAKLLGKVFLGSAVEAFGSTIGTILAAKLFGVDEQQMVEENEETEKEEEEAPRPPS